MSEENQENGTSNGGDVPEIELIIKEEFVFPKDEQEPSEQQQVQNYVFKMIPESEVKTINNIYLTYENQKLPHHIFVHLNCDDAIDNNGEIMQDNKEILSSAEDDFNRNDNKDTNLHVSSHEPTDPMLYDTDSVNQMDFESVVAEACDGLFDDIENDLDLNLKDDQNSRSSADFCECGVSFKGKRDSEAMQKAVAAVLDEGMSLGQAAKKYNVVKSTIWSRVSKHPKHRRRKINKELAEVIHSQLLAGESLSEISRALNIAKSTVHQHKTRLTKYGKLPTVLILKKDREGSSNGGMQDRLMQAYRGCRVNGMSVRFAAEFYSVPLTTLWRFIKRNQTASQNTVPIPAPRLEVSTSCEPNDEQLTKTPVVACAESADIDVLVTDDIKTELNPEDQQLFEDTYLNHLFE